MTTTIRNELKAAMTTLDRAGLALVAAPVPDPQKGESRQEAIEEAPHLPSGTPAANDAHPFIEHRRDRRGDENGKVVAAKHRGHERDDDHGNSGEDSDGKLVHLPPNRLSRAANCSTACANSSSPKSGHSVGVNISSA